MGMVTQPQKAVVPQPLAELSNGHNFTATISARNGHLYNWSVYLASSPLHQLIATRYWNCYSGGVGTLWCAWSEIDKDDSKLHSWYNNIILYNYTIMCVWRMLLISLPNTTHVHSRSMGGGTMYMKKYNLGENVRVQVQYVQRDNLMTSMW